MPTGATLHKTVARHGRHFLAYLMQTEAECPARARYLHADELYTDGALQLLRAGCIRRYQKREKDAASETFVHWTRQAYNTFVQWTRQPNEVVVYTWYAYADLALPKRFDCIFHVDNPREHLLVSYLLTQSVIDLGGGFPISSVEHGHKHICVLTFEQEVPAIFQLLHRLEGNVSTMPLRGAFQLGFCQVADLPAITAARERTARLRAQYGANWWKYDEEMSG